MGIFKKMGSTPKASGSKNADFLPGDFEGVITVVRLRVTESRKNDDMFFCVDGVVEESNLDEWPEGRQVAILIKLNDKWGYGMSDAKSLACAVTGADDADVDEAFMEELTGGDGTEAAGLSFYVETLAITTKDGKLFTKHYFQPAPDAE